MIINKTGMYIQWAQKTLAQVLPFVPVFWLLDHQMQKIKRLLLEVSFIKDNIRRKGENITSLSDRAWSLEDKLGKIKELERDINSMKKQAKEHDRRILILARHAWALDQDVQKNTRQFMDTGNDAVKYLKKRIDQLEQERNERFAEQSTDLVPRRG